MMTEPSSVWLTRAMRYLWRGTMGIVGTLLGAALCISAAYHLLVDQQIRQEFISNGTFAGLGYALGVVLIGIIGFWMARAGARIWWR
jgi:uncharacterized membrane protein